MSLTAGVTNNSARHSIRIAASGVVRVGDTEEGAVLSSSAWTATMTVVMSYISFDHSLIVFNRV
jgi:hypothetical protein